nr:hypothetical protein [Tanacetum cinerariifolium]
MIRNKARLVSQGYTQEEGIEYYEVFAPIARIKAIRLFLAYASFKDFMMYQMDVKSAFLYGKIEEEVYVYQPPGFEDLNFPDRVYKTLFIKRYKGDILLARVYVDDIIFGSTKNELCIAFKKLMHEKFQMSSIGELTFFLGLQVNQKKDDIFISQDKYVAKILMKFRSTKVKTASTPMETQKPLLKDEDGKEMDVHMYRSMIGSLMYLTSSRPDIMFVVCAYARYQGNPNVSHLHAVEWILRYLKGQPKLGLWYLKEYHFDLFAYTDSDYVGASLDKKSTTGDGKKIIVTESSVTRDLRLADEEGIDCLPNSTSFEQIALMGTKTTGWNEFSSTMASAIICLATNQKFNFSKFIFVSMIRNLDNVPGKILMYPRVGKGFSGRVTPLFPTMMIQNQSELGEGLAIPTDPQHTPTIIQPLSSQPQKTQKPRKPTRKDSQVPQPSGPTTYVADKAVHKELGDSLVRAATTASS